MPVGRAVSAAAVVGPGSGWPLFGSREADRLRILIATIREFAGSAAIEVKREAAAVHVAAGWAGRLSIEVNEVVKHGG
jgi:hypothetical protein